MYSRFFKAFISFLLLWLSVFSQLFSLFFRVIIFASLSIELLSASTESLRLNSSFVDGSFDSLESDQHTFFSFSERIVSVSRRESEREEREREFLFVAQEHNTIHIYLIISDWLTMRWSDLTCCCFFSFQRVDVILGSSLFCPLDCADSIMKITF